jgi:hypothetical protein
MFVFGGKVRSYVFRYLQRHEWEGLHGPRHDPWESTILHQNQARHIPDLRWAQRGEPMVWTWFFLYRGVQSLKVCPLPAFPCAADRGMAFSQRSTILFFLCPLSASPCPQDVVDSGTDSNAESCFYAMQPQEKSTGWLQWKSERCSPWHLF